MENSMKAKTITLIDKNDGQIQEVGPLNKSNS